MILKSLKLTNIRSYTSQEIIFPKGSVLLSGDIGSGKSSILLAIEFALFGVRRKHLPGSALLRYGKKKGEVELSFELDGKEVIIKRTLKKGKKEISQETGYIIINGIKKEATAVELKTDILNLLGYPSDLITKSRDLVYRYTLYTPQEEMKQILFEDKEIRLDTLRKVFNIDKYKKIRENSMIFVRELKEKKKLYEGNIAGLEEKKIELKKKQEDVKILKTKIDELRPNLEKAKEKIKKSKDELVGIENDVKNLNQLNNDLKLNDLQLKNHLSQRQNNKSSIEKLESQIKELEKETSSVEILNSESLKKDIEEKKLGLDSIEKDIKEINAKINELNTHKKYSENIKNKITGLDKCPTCEQEVDPEYKKNVLDRENRSINNFEEELSKKLIGLKESEDKIVKLKEGMESLKKKESEIKLIQFRIKNKQEKIKEKEELLNQQDQIKKEVGKINVKKSGLNEMIDSLKDREEKYVKLKKEVENNLHEEKKIELDMMGLVKEKQAAENMNSTLEKEIDDKMKIKQKLGHISQMQNWLENYFMGLMTTIEKHVMLNIYREFDELFQQWFNLMIEDETLNVRLDEEFTPMVEQNGYETTVENLSGGERTSVALAYRLALNKVINDIIGDIKTKDLIILDEPTDGFSSEQLDKVRDVLEQLNLKQTIIVSHESKIESFVDNVIRIEKDEQVSSAGP